MTKQQKILRGAEVLSLGLRAYAGGPVTALPVLVDLLSEVVEKHLPPELRQGLPGTVIALGGFIARAAGGGDPKELAVELADLLEKEVIPELREAGG